MTTASEIIGYLKKHRIRATNEAAMQDDTFEVLKLYFPNVKREVTLKQDGFSLGRIDFTVGTVGIECKVAGASAKDTHAQLSKYASCGEISEIVLLTARAMSIPAVAKPVSVVGIGSSWL